MWLSKAPPPPPPLPAGRSATTAAATRSRRLRNAAYVVGLLALTGSFAAYPFLASRGSTNLTLRDQGLTGSQIMRGAYVNSGSHDVGLDPDWDPVTRTRRVKGADTFNPTPEQVAQHRAEMEARRAAREGLK
jgi:hypothetical protein